jgi:hypothetical protein
LFVDYAGQAFLMIDPAGRIGRAMAPPNARDLNYIGGSAAAVDAQGRLVYRGLGPVYGPAAPDGSRQVVGGTASADSLPILRGDFQKRTVDTLTRVRNLNSSKSEVTTDGRGQTTIKIYLKPLPEGDEWAVLSDGSIAIVRGHDYHIDWIAPDGSRRSTPKMPFDWRRLTESDKQRIVDSLRAAREAEASASAAGGAGAPGGARGGSGGGPVMVQAAPMPAMAAGGAGDGVNRLPPKMEMVYPLPGEMPDYLPPIRSGAARADRDGNLWILPSTSSQSSGGELVYDVVNLKGEVFQRVRVPAGRSIAGFGKGGVVFLQGGDMRTGLTLERMRIKVDTKS